MAALFLLVFWALSLPMEVLAAAVNQGGGAGWAKSVEGKAEDFKVGLMSIAGVVLAIAGIIVAMVGALRGDVPWARVGALVFGGLLLGVIDQVVPELTKSSG